MPPKKGEYRLKRAVSEEEKSKRQRENQERAQVVIRVMFEALDVFVNGFGDAILGNVGSFTPVRVELGLNPVESFSLKVGAGCIKISQAAGVISIKSGGQHQREVAQNGGAAGDQVKETVVMFPQRQVEGVPSNTDLQDMIAKAVVEAMKGFGLARGETQPQAEARVGQPDRVPVEYSSSDDGEEPDFVGYFAGTSQLPGGAPAVRGHHEIRFRNKLIYTKEGTAHVAYVTTEPSDVPEKIPGHPIHQGLTFVQTPLAFEPALPIRGSEHNDPDTTVAYCIDTGKSCSVQPVRASFKDGNGRFVALCLRNTVPAAAR